MEVKKRMVVDLKEKRMVVVDDYTYILGCKFKSLIVYLSLRIPRLLLGQVKIYLYTLREKYMKSGKDSKSLLR